MKMWWYDIRHSLRRFRRQPLFAVIAVLTLAFGIGANVAAFSFVNAYLIAPLPAPDASALVRVVPGRPDGRPDVISYPTYADLRDQAKGIAIAGHASTRVLVGDPASAEMRPLELVTGNMFDVLRLQPLAGRLIHERDDATEGQHPVVVLAESLWRTRYAGRPDIVGQTLRLNGALFEIIGIAPAGFHGAAGARGADLWAPLSMQQLLRPRGTSRDRRGWSWMSMIGRVQTGIGTPAVRDSLNAAAASIVREFPNDVRPFALTVVPATSLPESDRAALQPYLVMTMAITALLLVVTCANLAGAMQARLLARRRELAIRQSLGATRARLVSEWFTESALLALGGGAAGILLAVGALALLQRFAPPPNLVDDINLATSFDWRVAVFAVSLTCGTALVFGLWPALRSASAQPVSTLKDESVSVTGGVRGSNARQAAVFLQVAVSVVLLVGSALMVASLSNLRQSHLGFDTSNLAMATVDLQFLHMPREQAASFSEQLLENLNRIPEVKSSAITNSMPLDGSRDSLGYRIAGVVNDDGTPDVSIATNSVGASYFATLGLRFVHGAPWTLASQSSPPAVINQTMAERYWPGRNPVGQTFELTATATLTVTGVVADSTTFEVGEAPAPLVYVPIEMDVPASFTLVARTSVDAAGLLPTLGRAIAATDPRASALSLTTFEAARQAPLYPRQMLASLAIVFGGVALLLTAVGVYGVVLMSVGQRTREFGVRLALGARPTDLSLGVLRDSAKLVGGGTALGLLAGYALAHSMRHFLFGVAPFDLTIYITVAAMLSLLALASAWIPARRASSVDPVEVLRA